MNYYVKYMYCIDVVYTVMLNNLNNTMFLLYKIITFLRALFIW